VAKKPETKFKEKAVRMLNTIPKSYWFKTQQKSLRGIPDLIGIIDGTFVALELKAYGKGKKSQPSPLQRKVMMDMVRAGGLVYVINPKNFDFIFQKLSYGYGSSRKSQSRTNIAHEDPTHTQLDLFPSPQKEY
jgi:hypothetical protein